MGWLFGIRGLSFSWKRFFGITNLKRWLARITGIPTTLTGFFAKVGRLLINGTLLRIAAWGVFLAAVWPDIKRKMVQLYSCSIQQIKKRK